jgi:hypothetical protein
MIQWIELCICGAALFAIRDSSFMEEVRKLPANESDDDVSRQQKKIRDKYCEAFVDEYQEVATKKLQILRDKIRTMLQVGRFPVKFIKDFHNLFRFSTTHSVKRLERSIYVSSEIRTKHPFSQI